MNTPYLNLDQISSGNSFRRRPRWSRPGGLAQIKQRDEEVCEEICGDDEDCWLECLEEDRGEVMRDPDDRGLAQVSNNGGRRDKGKGLAQTTGWFWDSEETSEDEKE